MEHAIERLKELCGIYGYPVLFVAVLLENAGVPVPGETALLVGGLLASQAGDYRFKLWVVILLTSTAAIIGDNIGFFLGRTLARPRLTQGRRFLLLTPATMRNAEDYFRRWGMWTVFLARFITGIRVVGALAAGTAGMPWPKFLVANAAGAVTWATAISLLGYFFGERLGFLRHWLHRGGLAALGLVVLFFIGLRVRRYWIARRQRATSGGETPAVNPPPAADSPGEAPEHPC